MVLSRRRWALVINSNATRKLIGLRWPGSVRFLARDTDRHVDESVRDFGDIPSRAVCGLGEHGEPRIRNNEGVTVLTCLVTPGAGHRV